MQIAVLLVMWIGLRFWNPLVANSLALGGLIAVIPQAWFAYRVFRWRRASAAQQIARAGYAAEIGKVVLAAGGFVVVFTLVRPLAGWALFAGYGVMLIIQVIGAWMLLRAAPEARF